MRSHRDTLGVERVGRKDKHFSGQMTGNHTRLVLTERKDLADRR